MVSTVEQLRGLVLSAADLRAMTNWPDALVEDYLNIISNVLLLAETADNATFEKIAFIIDADVTLEEGEVAWDEDDHTARIETGLGNTIQVGQEVWGIGVNKTGGTATDGKVVYFSGVQGQRPTYDYADARVGGKASLVGVVTSPTDNNQEGPVTTFGFVRNTDTSSWIEGTKLYIASDATGTLTSTPPSKWDFRIWVATVTNQHITQGSIFVDPRIDFAIDSTLNGLDLIEDLSLKDNGAAIFGDGDDVKVYYDGIDLFIKTGLVNPSDLVLDCGANKTLELTEKVYLDELSPLIQLPRQTPASRISADNAEAAVTFSDNCVYEVDYIPTNMQINHDWELGSDISPHLHWWQTSSDIPNWLIQYRWQKNGEAKTTAWTDAKYDAHAFTYTSGTLNQISSFGAITPPTGYNLSDIVQFRLQRDTNNGSGLFAGADPLTGDVSATSFDSHKPVNTLGSRQIFTK